MENRVLVGVGKFVEYKMLAATEVLVEVGQFEGSEIQIEVQELEEKMTLVGTAGLTG